MAIKNYKAKIKLPNNSVQEIVIQADIYFNAKAMIESQYGKEKIFSGPVETK